MTGKESDGNWRAEMTKTVKTTLIISAALIGLVAIAVGALQLVSIRIHDRPQETLTFALTAQTFHDKLDLTLLDNVEPLADRIAGGASDNASEMEALIMQGSLSSRGYRDQFTWLQPTSDTLDLYADLKQESSLVVTCYSKLYAALSEQRAGNDSLSAVRLDEARAARQQVTDLRAQNTAALDGLIADTRARLDE
jgi:hypothetical protein